MNRLYIVSVLALCFWIAKAFAKTNFMPSVAPISVKTHRKMKPFI